MAKRFLDDKLFEDEWFVDLPNKYKVLWLYLITKCDHAGIYKVSYKLMNFYIGEHLEPSEVKRILKDRIIEIENGKKWFLPKFLKFQYATGLNSNKPAITSVKEIIFQNNLVEIVQQSLGNDFLIIKDKDRDKDKVKDKDKEKNIAEDIPSDIQEMFIRTLGRNPKIPEVEETQKLIKQYGAEQVSKILREASLRNIKSFNYMISQLEITGKEIRLKPFNNNGKAQHRNKKLPEL